MAFNSFPIQTIAFPEKIYYTSSEGLVSDAQLHMGANPASATNNTAALDAILANADENTSILVFVDGKYRVDYIRPRSNTTIMGVGVGNGFILSTGSSWHMLANKNRSRSSQNGLGPISISDRNITISNVTLNGNGWVGAGNGAFSGPPEKGAYEQMAWNQERYCTEPGVGCFTFLMAFAGVENLKLSGVKLLNSRTYMGFFTNCRDVLVENSSWYINPAVPYGNMDGLDFVGRVENAWIVNCRGNCKDDCFAFASSYGVQSTNVNGGVVDNSVYGSNYYAFASHGDCVDSGVKGFFFDNSFMGFRVMSTDGLVDNIHVSGLRGRILGSMLMICDNYYSLEGMAIPEGDGTNGGIWTPTGAANAGGNIGRLVIEDIDVDMPLIYHNGGKGGQMYIGARIKDLIIKKWNRREDTANPNHVGRSMIFSSYCNIRNLHIEDFVFRYKTKAQEVFEMIQDCYIQNIQLRNITIDRGQATTFDQAPVFTFNWSNVKTMQASGITMINCTAAIVVMQPNAIKRIQATGCRVYNVSDAGAVATDTVGFVALAAGATLDSLVMSNFDGTKTHSGGTITQLKGDAF